MSRPDPAVLLERAGRAIDTETSTTASETDHRRAASDAYYALFHALVHAAAEIFSGDTDGTSAIHALIYRSIEHRSIRRACEIAVMSKLPRPHDTALRLDRFGAEVRAIAGAFNFAYDQRQRADYDPSSTFEEGDVAHVIDHARRAIIALAAAPDDERRVFLAMFVFPVRRPQAP
jgi:uncharacterized protein (UPF0332 family)